MNESTRYDLHGHGRKVPATFPAGLGALLIGGLLLSAAGCAPARSEAEFKTEAETAPAPRAAAAQPQAVPVRVVELQPERLEESFSLSGQTFADRSVTLAAETAGRVERLRVALGDGVRRGQILARVDFRLLKARVDQADAEHVLAHKTLDRMELLRQRKAISQQAVDEAVARDHLAEASLRLARARLDKSLVRAPISGVVTARRIEVGEHVNPGQPMLEITDLNSVMVRAQVAGRLVDRLQPGLPVEVELPALERSMAGRVDLVVPVAAGASRTFELRVALERERSDAAIAVGLDARLAVRAAVHEHALVIGQDLVLERPQGRQVFVVADGKAVGRAVELGPVAGQRVMVRSGLQAGDALVIEGHRDLSDGQPVRVSD